MKIAVCVKQVPETNDVRINPETNTLMREGVESILNPFDAYALEQALALKDAFGARVIVVSMGLPQACAVLREALARGADEAYLVSSSAFGGSDTLATGYALSRAILKACGGGRPDLVLFGKQAIDGDTAQVGPCVSEFLDLPLVAYVKELRVDGASGTYRAATVMDDGERVVEGALPAVMTVLREAATPRFAPLAGAMAAARAEIKILDENAIGADLAQVGLRGSPTKVVSIFPPPARGNGIKIAWTGDAASLAAKIRETIDG